MIATPKKEADVTTPARTPLRFGEINWLYVIIRGNRTPPAHPIRARAIPTKSKEPTTVISPMSKNNEREVNIGTTPITIEKPNPLILMILPNEVPAIAPRTPATRSIEPVRVSLTAPVKPREVQTKVPR
jgi:hypothetical protein